MNISHTPEKQINIMFIFQLLRFSRAEIANLESKMPPDVNYRQVIPRGLWDSFEMKPNDTNV